MWQMYVHVMWWCGSALWHLFLWFFCPYDHVLEVLLLIETVLGQYDFWMLSWDDFALSHFVCHLSSAKMIFLCAPRSFAVRGPQFLQRSDPRPRWFRAFCLLSSRLCPHGSSDCGLGWFCCDPDTWSQFALVFLWRLLCPNLKRSALSPFGIFCFPNLSNAELIILLCTPLPPMVLLDAGPRWFCLVVCPPPCLPRLWILLCLPLFSILLGAELIWSCFVSLCSPLFFMAVLAEMMLLCLPLSSWLLGAWAEIRWFCFVLFCLVCF